MQSYGPTMKTCRKPRTTSIKIIWSAVESLLVFIRHVANTCKHNVELHVLPESLLYAYRSTRLTPLSNFKPCDILLIKFCDIFSRFLT